MKKQSIFQKYANYKVRLTLLVLLLCPIYSSAQSKLPNDSYATILDANALMISNPRKALTMLAPLKKTFITESSYENIEDVVVYQTILSAENSIHSLNGNHQRIFANLRDFQRNIEPFLENDDRYAQFYFLSKVYHLTYKAQEKGGMLIGNPRYRGALHGILAEVRAFSFKDKKNGILVESMINQNL
ncbi:hypothetical protein ACFQZJ_06115 [Maribacter chungangensis]|uniref:Uncharacterized protein n=1 Tax=Maribacter chungangensis TaxID=1069117 RepID=A0ABW3B2F1_9FLAO